MDLLCDQANLSLDHTAQKEKSELAHRGKLGKRRRPSRVYLKASLVASPPTEDDETQLKIGKKLKNEGDKSDQINSDECLTNGDVDDENAAIIKHGPKGTIIEIGTRRTVEIPAINHSEKDDSFTGPVIKGAILKIPETRNMEKQSVNVIENGIHASSDDEADFLVDDNASRRWKSLPSLCQDDKNAKTELKEDAPWIHEVKLRHVENPESPKRKGCSMLFFGPLPKPAHSPVDGSSGNTAAVDNDSPLPLTELKSTETFRPVRMRPASMCEHVQIQTWDRRHLTANSRINTERKPESKFHRNDPVRSSKIWQDIPQITDALINNNEYPEDKQIINRSKTKKRWKTDTFENGVHRSKSLNGIDTSNQPEWIEISKKVTSKNIDWENLPTAKKGSQGKSFQSELRIAWKKLGNQLNSEPLNGQKIEEKEEIVLKEDDLPVIRNGLTKQEFLKLSSKRFSHWEKLDANANSQCQKKTVPAHNHVPESQKQNSTSSQYSNGSRDVSWIKEAEKRRQKYMDWQCQASKEEENSTKQQDQERKDKESAQQCAAINHSPPIQSPNAESKKEENREESSPFPVKLRRVRCAKPEECFHEVKCTLPPSEAVYEERSSPVPRPQSPASCQRSKAANEENKISVHNESSNESQNLSRLSTGESFSVQLSDYEGDNFYVVINERDDDSFLQIQCTSDVANSDLEKESVKSEGVIKVDSSPLNRRETNFKPIADGKEELVINNHLSSDNEDVTASNCVQKAINGARLSNSDTPTDDDNSEVFLDVNQDCIDRDQHDAPACNDIVNGIQNGIFNGGNESLQSADQKEKTKEKQNGFVTKKTRNGIQETYENLTINGISAIPIYPRKTKRSHKTETLEEKATRMTNDICGVLSSLGRQKTELERQSLHRDILKTLTCPTIHQSVETPSRTLTLVTCDGDGLVASSVQGRMSELSSVGVQTNCDEVEQEAPEEKKNTKKVQTRIKKKTVKIIIHECDDDEEKQEVVEEIVEQILEPRLQKGKMVRKEPIICRAVEETEDGQKYLATTVTDGCTFCVDDS